MVVLTMALLITMLLRSLRKFHRVFEFVPFFMVFRVKTRDGGGGSHRWFVDEIPMLVHLSMCKDREGAMH